eukprot:5368230-Alexandrium_andersonii.AAC.1
MNVLVAVFARLAKVLLGVVLALAVAAAGAAGRCGPGGSARDTGAVRGGDTGCGRNGCDGRVFGAVGWFRCAAGVAHGVAVGVSCAAAVVLAGGD